MNTLTQARDVRAGIDMTRAREQLTREREHFVRNNPRSATLAGRADMNARAYGIR